MTRAAGWAAVVLLALILVALTFGVRVNLPGSTCGTTFVGPCPVIEIGR